MSKHEEQSNYLTASPIFDDEGKELDFILLQELVRQNKIEKGFNTTDPLYEFAFLAGEFGELAQAIKDPKFEDLDEALVDIIIFVLGFFAMYEVDGAQLIAKKIEFNQTVSVLESDTNYPVRSERLKIKHKIDWSPNLDYQLSFSDIATKIIKVKETKNYNLDPKKVEHEFVLMTEEIAELLDGIKTEDTDKTYSALADIFIYALGHLEIRQKPSYELITKKIAHNSSRNYEVIGETKYKKLNT